MKRLALPIILFLVLVLVTAFGCVQDENVPETPPGDGQTNIGRLDFMTAGVTQRYDEMMTESGIEHEFYLTDGGHDFSTWSDGLHTFVLNIFGAESDAESCTFCRPRGAAFCLSVYKRANICYNSIKEKEREI